MVIQTSEGRLINWDNVTHTEIKEIPLRGPNKPTSRFELQAVMVTGAIVVVELGGSGGDAIGLQETELEIWDALKAGLTAYTLCF